MAAPSPIRRYRLLPGAFPEAKRRQIRSLAPQLAIMVAVVLFSALIATRQSRGTPLAIFWAPAALYLVYIGLVSVPRMRRRLTKCWGTYSLEIGPDYLLRQQADTPDIRMPFSEIKRVERLQGRYLRVIGSAKHAVIAIPEGIETFSEVLQVVSGLGSTTPLRRDRTLRYAGLTALGFGAYMFMLWTKSPWIVVPFAAVVATLLIWLFLFMRRSPNVGSRPKRMSWFYLIFIVICILKVVLVITPVASR